MEETQSGHEGNKLTYDITIKKQGSLILTVEGIEAKTAIGAIATVENHFKLTVVQVLGPNGTFREYLWTGLEFEARRLDFSLS